MTTCKKTCSVFLFLLSAGLLCAGEIRVMTWNLMDMDLFDGNGADRIAWQLNAEAEIASVIRSVSPDVLFITEAPSLVELRQFVQAHGLGYQVFHVRQQAGNRDFADSMALLTRLPVLSAELVTPTVPGSSRGSETTYLDWSYRGLLVVKFSNFTLIGVHLKSPWDGQRRSYETRHSQVLGLVDYVGTISGPVLILGDFNDTPGRDATETSYGLPDMLSLLGPAFRRAQGDEITQEDGLNLDHIFFKGGTAGTRRVVETPWTTSDHRPVWSNLQF